MKAKCLEIKYEEGWYSSSQNTKKCDIRREKGMVHWDNGNGWQRNYKSSSYILITEFEGEQHKVYIDGFFKHNYGKLIESRRDIIEKNMPEEIELEKVSKDSIFYKCCEKELKDWLKRCVNKNTKKEKIKKESIPKLIKKDKPTSNISPLIVRKQNKDDYLELKKDFIIDLYNQQKSMSVIIQNIKKDGIGLVTTDIKVKLKEWNVFDKDRKQCTSTRNDESYIRYNAIYNMDKTIIEVFKFRWECREWLV